MLFHASKKNPGSHVGRDPSCWLRPFSLVLQEQPTQANYANICTGLEILSFLLTVLQSPAILGHFKPLQRGIAACMTCGNTKVLRAVHTLLSRLMSIFPTEPSESRPPSGQVGDDHKPGCLSES